MSYAKSMVMAKRSGRDRRVSVYFPPPEGERRAYQDRRVESASEEVVEPSYLEKTDSAKVKKGPIARGRSATIVVLIIAAVLVVLL